VNRVDPQLSRLPFSGSTSLFGEHVTRTEDIFPWANVLVAGLQLAGLEVTPEAMSDRSGAGSAYPRKLCSNRHSFESIWGAV
jgi:hypothetical protein